MPHESEYKKASKSEGKMHKVMSEFKAGTLHSGKPGQGKGPAVKSKAQAIAIALSEARKAGANIPKKKWRMAEGGKVKA